MINKNIIICALARDCEKSLEINIPKIELLRKHFASSKVIVVENDSLDNTKIILNDWRTKSNDVYLILNDFGTLTIKPDLIDPLKNHHRIEKMAKYRNLYIDFISSLSSTIDYVMIIDIDIIDFSVSGIIKSINNAPQNWGSLFANGTQSLSIFGIQLCKRQYDIFAFQHYKYDVLNEKYRFYYKRKIDKIISKNSFTKCISGFGGIGIYKWDAIKGIRYIANKNTNTLNEYYAEHIHFNKTIIENSMYSNYIAKELTVDYGKGNLKMFLRVLFP